MKKLFSLIAAVLLTATAAHAQFGVIAGFTSSSNTFDSNNVMSNLKGVALFHGGVAYRVPLGSFIALQPELLYQTKASSLSASGIASGFSSQTGYLELALGVQAGLDLLVFQPFLLVEPFVGVALTGKEVCNVVNTMDESISAAAQAVKSKLEGGFGFGGGVQLLGKIQVSVQYFLNLGNLYNEDKIDQESAMAAVSAQYKEIRNYHGLKVSFGYFF